jgi:hypothetical protein
MLNVIQHGVYVKVWLEILKWNEMGAVLELTYGRNTNITKSIKYSRSQLTHCIR